MSQVSDFIKRLDACPAGSAGWSTFEKLCVEILQFLFRPALTFHSTQARTYSNISRMDAIFANRNITPSSDPLTKNWHHLYVELGARLVLFEFKNYDRTEINQDEVNQTRNYLTKPMGKLAIMICNKKPIEQAHRMRNTIYSSEQKVILFLTKKELKEMLATKERDEDPSDLIVDLVEDFYIQHE
jgi:hypothetical protein